MAGETGKEVGKRLKQLRENKSFTLREVGEAVDIDYSYLGRIERGNLPSTKLLEKLADYYGVSVAYLFGDEIDVSAELKEVGVEWIAFAKEMKDKNLTPEQIKTILEVIGQLNKE